MTYSVNDYVSANYWKGEENVWRVTRADAGIVDLVNVSDWEGLAHHNVPATDVRAADPAVVSHVVWRRERDERNKRVASGHTFTESGATENVCGVCGAHREYHEVRAVDGLEPYDSFSALSSADCEYCGEGWDIPHAHRHDYYVSRDGAASHTADELCAIFIEDVEGLTTWRAGAETHALITKLYDSDQDGDSYWFEDPDDSQALHDAANESAESALSAAGFAVDWDDGCIIQRVTEWEEIDAAYVDVFERGYVECELWAGSDLSTGRDEGGNETDMESFSDQGFEPGDVAPATLRAMHADCEAFIASEAAQLATILPILDAYKAGMDFSLTRNGHGTGYWDEGYKQSDEINAALTRLTDASRLYGETSYFSEDGEVHIV